MPIVDFEQDPQAPLGTGNFIDDKGRAMYLSDPDTASQFIKTTDQRLAKNTPIAADGPPLPNAQYLTDNQERSDADIAGLEQAVDAHDAAPAPGAPPAAPIAPGTAPAATSSGTPLPPTAPLTGAEKAPLTPTPAELGSLNSFDTPLSPAEEKAYQAWKQQYAPNDSGADYDLRGAFKAGVKPSPTNGHWPDTFKKPNHPTFSVESQYASAAPDKAGHWEGERYIPASGGAAAPGAPAATTGGPGAQLVSTLGGIQQSMSARSQAPAAPETPEPFDSNGLPLASVGQGDTMGIKQGRDINRVVEEAQDLDATGAVGDKLIRDTYAQQGQRAAQGYEASRNAAGAEYGKNVNTAFEKSAETRAAEQKVAELKKELEAIDNSLDPDRVMRNMSTGKTLAMIILAALNGGFGAITKNTQNGVLTAMDNAVNRDIDRQKDEIRSGHVRKQNDIDFYLKKGFDAATAEKFARDNLIGNLAAFKDAEAKRLGAGPEAQAAANLLIQPRIEQRMKDRAAILRTAENEVTVSSRRDMQHAVPQMVPGMSPQDALAMQTLLNKRTESENTKPVERAVGHAVSPDEAKDIKDEAKDFAKRKALVDSTRNAIKMLATELKLFKSDKGWEGTPDAGLRPGGSSAFSAQARNIDRLYSLVSRADIMSMTREPANELQKRYAEITDRPFWDNDIPTQLNALTSIIDEAEGQLRQGYNDDALNYYARARQPAPPAAGAPPPAASPPPASPAPSGTAPPAPPGPGKAKRPGDLRAE